MNSQTLTRNELYDLVWSTPFTLLAKKYSISNVGLKKVCVKMEIPIPKSGHWQKIQFKKFVEITKLHPDYSGENEITLNLRKEGDNSTKGFPSEIDILEKKIKNTTSFSIIVPDRLTNPDKLIVAAKTSLTKHGAYLDHGLVRTSRDEVRIRVTPGNVSRALRFMDTFIKVMQTRGHQILIENSLTYVVLHREKIEISFREKLKRVQPGKYTWQEYDYLATGILTFNAKRYTYNVEWKDGKLPIEKQLARIIAKLEIKGEELKNERIERKTYWAKYEEEKRIADEIKKSKEKELAKFNDLLIKAKKWQEAEILRSYLDNIEAMALSKNEISEELKNWLLWARKKTDWYDPQVELTDELLDNKND